MTTEIDPKPPGRIARSGLWLRQSWQFIVMIMVVCLALVMMAWSVVQCNQQVDCRHACKERGHDLSRFDGGICTCYKRVETVEDP